MEASTQALGRCPTSGQSTLAVHCQSDAGALLVRVAGSPVGTCTRTLLTLPRRLANLVCAYVGSTTEGPDWTLGQACHVTAVGLTRTDRSCEADSALTGQSWAASTQTHRLR